MHCPICGREIPDSSTFCPYCGGNLRTNPSYPDTPGSPHPHPLPKEKKDHPFKAIALMLLTFAATFAIVFCALHFFTTHSSNGSDTPLSSFASAASSTGNIFEDHAASEEEPDETSSDLTETSTAQTSTDSIMPLSSKEEALAAYSSAAYDPDEIKPSFIAWQDSGLQDHVMDWKDPALEAKMRQITGISSREIHLSNVYELTDLDLTCNPNAGDQKIHDISALAELKNVTKISMNYNAVSDISAFQSMPNLRTIYLNSNNVSDARIFNGLTQITSIDISNNPITNFAPFGKLPYLRSLYIYNCGVTDSSFSQIADMIASMKYFKILDVGGNQISDWSPLAHLSNLYQLNVWDSQINDTDLQRIVDCFKNSDRFYTLHMGNNQVTDISCLGELKHLSDLTIEKNQVSTIDVLKKFHYFRQLNVKDNPITDYTVLDTLQIDLLKR